MNKPIQLALFFTLIVTGCSNSSTSAEPKMADVKTIPFHQEKLEKELKKLKPVSLERTFESPLAAELGKRKAKEEAEKQRQIAAAKKREKEREAKRKKQQEEEAERQRLAEQPAAAERQRLAERQAELERQRQAARQKEREAQAQRQQSETRSSNSQHAPSSSNQTDDTIQQPAPELPDNDGYG